MDYKKLLNAMRDAGRDEAAHFLWGKVYGANTKWARNSNVDQGPVTMQIGTFTCVNFLEKKQESAWKRDYVYDVVRMDTLQMTVQEGKGTNWNHSLQSNLLRTFISA